jgi:hypothetical protein
MSTTRKVARRRPGRRAIRRVAPRVTQVVKPADDPAEAVERIVPRRHLLIERGDILISRASVMIRAAEERDIYQLSRQDIGVLPGRYTSFEHAVVAGDELATRQRVRH